MGKARRATFPVPHRRSHQPSTNARDVMPMFELIKQYGTDALTVLFVLAFLLIGAFVWLGGFASLRRYFCPESQRYRSVFTLLALITFTITGAFFAIMSAVLLHGILTPGPEGIHTTDALQLRSRLSADHHVILQLCSASKCDMTI